jgi:hypothetical protein
MTGRNLRVAPAVALHSRHGKPNQSWPYSQPAHLDPRTLPQKEQNGSDRFGSSVAGSARLEGYGVAVSLKILTQQVSQ